jgi:hypothetical protein
MTLWRKQRMTGSADRKMKLAAGLMKDSRKTGFVDRQMMTMAAARTNQAQNWMLELQRRLAEAQMTYRQMTRYHRFLHHHWKLNIRRQQLHYPSRYNSYSTVAVLLRTARHFR